MDLVYRSLSIRRTLLAALEWRIIATLTDLAVIYLITGDLKQATGLAVTLAVVKTVVFILWHRYLADHTFSSIFPRKDPP